MYSIKLGPEKSYCGEGSVSQLEFLSGERKRVYIVMNGDFFVHNGMLDMITQVLDKGGFQWEVNTDVEPEPSVETVLKGAKAMAAFEPDWIIGFGGGSAMDAAKAMWVFYENEEAQKITDVAAPNDFKKLRNKAKMIGIPTTAGTGSEMTRAALIKDTVSKRKYSIRCLQGRLVPDMAILDPVFTKTLPPPLTASTGMDALTHAIESYVTKNANPFSESLSLYAYKLSMENLPLAYKNGEDMYTREQMLVASAMGGMAFSNSALGIVHAIAHTFGAEFNIGHGLANAVALPYGIEFNSRDEAVKEKYDYLAYVIKKECLYDAIIALREELNIPASMKDVLQNDQLFEDSLEVLTEKALLDVTLPANPVAPTKDEMKELLRKVYYGK